MDLKKLEELPDELIFEILAKVKLQDVLRVCAGSKRLRRFCHDRGIWKIFYRRDIDPKAKNLGDICLGFKPKSWKEAYIGNYFAAVRLYSGYIYYGGNVEVLTPFMKPSGVLKYAKSQLFFILSNYYRKNNRKTPDDLEDQLNEVVHLKVGKIDKPTSVWGKNYRLNPWDARGELSISISIHPLDFALSQVEIVPQSKRVRVE